MVTLWQPYANPMAGLFQTNVSTTALKTLTPLTFLMVQTQYRADSTSILSR